LRFICIVFGGTSRGDSAECAASRTNISQDHKRSRTRSPAFPHVGAIAAFADSVQLVLVHHPPHLGILRANRKFDPKPVGFLSAWLVAYNRKLDHICSLFFSGVAVFYTPLFARRYLLVRHLLVPLFVGEEHQQRRRPYTALLARKRAQPFAGVPGEEITSRYTSWFNIVRANVGVLHQHSPTPPHPPTSTLYASAESSPSISLALPISTLIIHPSP